MRHYLFQEAIGCVLYLCFWLASCGIAVTAAVESSTSVEQFGWIAVRDSAFPIGSRNNEILK